jgi:hypothetical protein
LLLHISIVFLHFVITSILVRLHLQNCLSFALSSGRVSLGLPNALDHQNNNSNHKTRLDHHRLFTNLPRIHFDTASSRLGSGIAIMDTTPHSRSTSSDTSSAGSSYNHILDHVFTYGTSYEMPLRTMYTLNCAPRAQPHPPRRGTPSSSTDSSPTTPNMPSGWQDSSATHIFHEHLLAQMSSLPSQPTSLPPSFITSFLGKCFPPELVCVDFPQALTGLDYLKDLESRRQKEATYAMNRLDIDRARLSTDPQLQSQYPAVALWLKSIEDKERKIESLYTQLYVGLRRWVSALFVTFPTTADHGSRS